MTRALLKQSLDDLVEAQRRMQCQYPPPDFGETIDAIRAELAKPAQQERKPAWHDAPTCDGVWLCDEGDICYTWTAHNIEILDQFDPGSGLLWYGPIPEDKL